MEYLYFLLAILGLPLITIYLLNHSREDLSQTVEDYKKQISYEMETIDALKTKISSLEAKIESQASALVQKDDDYSRQKNILTYNYSVEIEQLKRKLAYYESLDTKRKDYLDTLLASDILTTIPYIASLIADYKTIDLDYAIASLSWGRNKAREKKVQSLIEIKRTLKETIEAYKSIEYQLDYLKTLFPAIDNILETNYSDLTLSLSLQDSNSVKTYLSDTEYNSLSECDRNQLALDRYVVSHSKNNWEIGRDYELYVGYKYSVQGYNIDYYGSYMKLNDLGRDLIAKRGSETLIIQCKYWSKDKIIHEKHIAQLYGTYICYCLENHISEEKVHPVFITSTSLSEQAKTFCDYLKIFYKENFPLGDFPRIKCNIGVDEYGFESRIYHLPMDQQYDNVKIDKHGEFFAFTVAEAESKGFRRAYKWHSSE